MSSFVKMFTLFYSLIEKTHYKIQENLEGSSGELVYISQVLTSQLIYIYILYSRSSLIKHNLEFMTNIFGLSLVVSLFNNYYTNTIIKLHFSRLFNLLLIYSSLLSTLYYSTHDITYSTCYYSSIVIHLFIMVVHI